MTQSPFTGQFFLDPLDQVWKILYKEWRFAWLSTWIATSQDLRLIMVNYCSAAEISILLFREMDPTTIAHAWLAVSPVYKLW